MSDWFDIRIPIKNLGRMTEKGYYIRLPNGNWYITASTKLVRVNESSDFFTLATKKDFIYNAVEKKKDETGTIRQTKTGFISGEDVADLFKKV